MANKKSVVVGTGLTAAAVAGLSAPPAADALGEIAQLSADVRPIALLAIVAPALAWVLFNIGGPALNQVETMANKKSVVVGTGLTAAAVAGLSAPPAADAP